MLTAHQATTVAYITEGGILCPECASAEHGLVLSLADERFRDYPEGVSPLCRYNLDEMQSERAYDDPDNYPEDNYEVWPREACDGCGQELDH